jgi:hypothetical protein
VRLRVVSFSNLWHLLNRYLCIGFETRRRPESDVSTMGRSVMRYADVSAPLLALFVAAAGAQPAPPPAAKPGTAASSTATPAVPQPLRAASLGLAPYPAKKQSMEQQLKDDGECFDWTKQSTGIDPAAPVAAPAQTADSGHTGERARGAVRGAARGAVIGGAIDNKGGEGAAAGAVVGGARSREKEESANEASKHQADAAAKSEQNARLDTFRKGYSACMETRGYSVK